MLVEVKHTDLHLQLKPSPCHIIPGLTPTNAQGCQEIRFANFGKLCVTANYWGEDSQWSHLLTSQPKHLPVRQ